MRQSDFSFDLFSYDCDDYPNFLGSFLSILLQYHGVKTSMRRRTTVFLLQTTMLSNVWMKTFDMDGQMKDTKMSDSPSTAVARRFNSQHQSDKLPDKVVQPCRRHDGWQARGAQAGFKAKRTSLACRNLAPTLGKKAVYSPTKQNKMNRVSHKNVKKEKHIKTKTQKHREVNFHLLKPE